MIRLVQSSLAGKDHLLLQRSCRERHKKKIWTESGSKLLEFLSNQLSCRLEVAGLFVPGRNDSVFNLFKFWVFYPKPWSNRKLEPLVLMENWG